MNSIIGENVVAQACSDAARSFEQLETQLHNVIVQRDAFETKALALETRALSEAERFKTSEVSMQALTKVAQSLERSNPEWDIIVDDVQAQCDAAEARGMVSTARACSLEQTLAANTRFLQDISHQMEEARSEGSAAAPEYFLVTGLSQLRTGLHTSEELAKDYTRQSTARFGARLD